MENGGQSGTLTYNAERPSAASVNGSREGWESEDIQSQNESNHNGLPNGDRMSNREEHGAFGSDVIPPTAPPRRRDYVRPSPPVSHFSSLFLLRVTC